jgi:hypothetical protein
MASVAAIIGSPVKGVEVRWLILDFYLNEFESRILPK